MACKQIHEGFGWPANIYMRGLDGLQTNTWGIWMACKIKIQEGFGWPAHEYKRGLDGLQIKNTRGVWARLAGTKFVRCMHSVCKCWSGNYYRQRRCRGSLFIIQLYVCSLIGCKHHHALTFTVAGKLRHSWGAGLNEQRDANHTILHAIWESGGASSLRELQPVTNCSVQCKITHTHTHTHTRELQPVTNCWVQCKIVHPYISLITIPNKSPPLFTVSHDAKKFNWDWLEGDGIHN